MFTCCLICKRLKKSKHSCPISLYTATCFTLSHWQETSLFSGVGAEECSRTVLAARHTFNVPAGGRLSLSCGVQHCGEPWTGHWVFENSTQGGLNAVEASPRHRLTHVELSGNTTQQILELLNINQSDEGFYGCSVKWRQGDTAQGHLTYVNVTTGM